MAGVDDDERSVLERLADGPPVGLVRNAQTGLDSPDTAPKRLIARGLLVPIDAQSVELPREVGLTVRAAPRRCPARRRWRPSRRRSR